MRLDFIKNVLPPSTTEFLFIVSKWIGGLLLSAIVSAFVISRLIDVFTGPGAYFVYLVGDFSDHNLEELRRAFENQQKANLKIANIDIHFISLDAKEKDAEKISARLAEKKDTLLVIGHLSSTASADALPNYLKADPPIPVILASETNPELLPPDDGINYLPVFRLSPTDNKQAEKAADFIVDQGAKNIWVVEDVVINHVYSRYLAQEFIRKVDEKSQLLGARHAYERSQLHEARQAYEKSQLREKRQAYEMKASKVVLWTKNLEPPSTDVVRVLGIDWVFFAGSPSNCLILTRQITGIWKDTPNKPGVLLTNSCVSLELLQKGGPDMKQAFLTHPMLASDFNERGFEVRGTQAFQLLQQLITGADYGFRELSSRNGGIWANVHWVFGFHRVADARNALRAFMEHAVNSDQSFLLEKQRYTFNRDGTAKETAFHVWQVQTPSNGTEFTYVEKPTNVY